MPANRQQDERLLALVAARSRGYSLKEIAQEFQTSTAGATTQTNKVMDADLDESGEDVAVVNAAYWSRKE